MKIGRRQLRKMRELELRRMHNRLSKDLRKEKTREQYQYPFTHSVQEPRLR
jgi:hypothetical protein